MRTQQKRGGGINKESNVGDQKYGFLYYVRVTHFECPVTGGMTGGMKYVWDAVVIEQLNRGRQNERQD